MDFLEEAKKTVAASAGYEIIDVEPLSFMVPEKVDKGNAITTVRKREKRTCPQV